MANQKIPGGDYHFDRMIGTCTRHGADVACCGTAYPLGVETLDPARRDLRPYPVRVPGEQGDLKDNGLEPLEPLPGSTGESVH